VLSRSECDFESWNSPIMSFVTWLQNLELFGVDLLWFGRLVAILEVLEVHGDFHAFWHPIRGFRSYLDDLTCKQVRKVFLDLYAYLVWSPEGSDEFRIGFRMIFA